MWSTTRRRRHTRSTPLSPSRRRDAVLIEVGPLERQLIGIGLSVGVDVHPVLDVHGDGLDLFEGFLHARTGGLDNTVVHVLDQVGQPRRRRGELLGMTVSTELVASCRGQGVRARDRRGDPAVGDQPRMASPIRVSVGSVRYGSIAE